MSTQFRNLKVYRELTVLIAPIALRVSMYEILQHKLTQLVLTHAVSDMLSHYSSEFFWFELLLVVFRFPVQCAFLPDPITPACVMAISHMV